MSHISHYNEYNLLYLNELIRLTYYTPYALIDYVFALAPIHTVLSSLKNASMSQNGLIFHGFEQRELRLNSVQKFQKFEMSQFLRRKHSVQCIIPKCRNATDVVLK